jgi:RNA polymerase sigma-70 factor (ECF subfamily)
VLAGMTDEQLVSALQAGDTDSLGILVTRWEQPLFRFVYRMLLRREDAKEICQETFLRILKKADRFRSGSRFSTWMYQIALNLCRDRARRKKRWGLVMATPAELPERAAEGATIPGGSNASAMDPAETAEREQLARAVRRALQRLPAEQREVVLLKEYEGLKFREIAEIVGCPESTVKSRMYYGLSSVRTVLESQGITGA